MVDVGNITAPEGYRLSDPTIQQQINKEVDQYLTGNPSTALLGDDYAAFKYTDLFNFSCQEDAGGSLTGKVAMEVLGTEYFNYDAVIYCAGEGYVFQETFITATDSYAFTTGAGTNNLECQFTVWQYGDGQTGSNYQVTDDFSCGGINDAPNAFATYDLTNTTNSNKDFTASASGSTDPEGATLSYSWRVASESTYGNCMIESSGASVTGSVTAIVEGRNTSCTFELTATDPAGNFDTDTFTLSHSCNDDGDLQYEEYCATQSSSGGTDDGGGTTTDTDQDNDGISNYYDQCDYAREDYDGIEDNDGCPDDVTDSDGDGTYDSQDFCPFEAGPSSNNGCPADDSGQDPGQF